MPDYNQNVNDPMALIRAILDRDPTSDPGFAKEVLWPSILGMNPGSAYLKRQQRISEETQQQDMIRNLIGGAVEQETRGEAPGTVLAGPEQPATPGAEPLVTTKPVPTERANPFIDPQGNLQAFKVDQFQVKTPMGTITLEANDEAIAANYYTGALATFTNMGYATDEAQKAAYVKTIQDLGIVVDKNVVDMLKLNPAQQYTGARNTFMRLLTTPQDGGYPSAGAIWKTMQGNYSELTPEDRDSIYTEGYNQFRSILRTDPEFRMMFTQESGLTPGSPAFEEELDLVTSRMASEQLDGFFPPGEAERTRLRATRVEDLPDKNIQQELIAQGANLTDVISNIDVRKAQQTLQQREVEHKAEMIRATEITKVQIVSEAVRPYMKRIIDYATVLNTEEGFRRWVHKAKLKGLALWQTGGPMLTLPDGRKEYMGTLAKSYEDGLEAFLGQIARVYGGERGVLTNQDIARIMKAFPLLGMGAGVTQDKILLLKQLENEFSKRTIGSARGQEGEITKENMGAIVADTMKTVRANIIERKIEDIF